jgi:ribosomal-protein-alanine N-acetyltransferase
MTKPHAILIVPELSHLDELFDFEMDNRAFFESRINARAPEFYSKEGVRHSIAAAMQQAKMDHAFQYLIHVEDELVGRVNLTQVRRQHFHSASLGYRIGEKFNGCGYAKQAVSLALTKAFESHHLLRVEACASPQNIASIHVLQANGFNQFGHAKRSFELHGVWHDTLHFEVHAPGFMPL